MKWNDIYNYYKDKYSEYLIFYKLGNFYTIIGRDIYIMNYIFDYKIITNNNIEKVGFPVNNINKVINKLNELRINYLTIEKIDNFVQVTYKRRFKENNYISYINISDNYSEKKNKINNITSILNSKINNPNFDNIINKIEEIIDER